TKRLYAAYFCRGCGQEYHPVRLIREDGGQKLLPRDIDDMPKTPAGDGPDSSDDDQQAERLGFILPLNPTDPLEFQGLPEDYPETWIETTSGGGTRLKRDYRHLAAERLSVDPSGRVGTGNPVWFMPGKFRYCLRCRAVHGAQGKDNN